MPRGMIAAPAFMPPGGMGFPGGIPQMPPLPGGMPQFPGMPPQQPAPPPQAPQPQAPPVQYGQPQYGQPQAYPQPQPAGQPWAYQNQPQVPAQPLPQPQPYAGFGPYTPYPYQAPVPTLPPVTPDPVAASQLALLQQAVAALQIGQTPAAQPAPPAHHPVEGGEAPKVQTLQPPVSRVGGPGTYTTKGQGIQYSTRN